MEMRITNLKDIRTFDTTAHTNDLSPFLQAQMNKLYLLKSKHHNWQSCTTPKSEHAFKTPEKTPGLQNSEVKDKSLGKEMPPSDFFNRLKRLLSKEIPSLQNNVTNVNTGTNVSQVENQSFQGEDDGCQSVDINDGRPARSPCMRSSCSLGPASKAVPAKTASIHPEESGPPSMVQLPMRQRFPFMKR
ncbi:hypothetical protein P7K49_003116 [Saguinus oedipus]|uniref:Uncharacterized protein n=1 Tax=Saguinus oedipus TaxID=9490 RepID=A0ABQ9WJ99_SAGOE|nr:hypothetical protein P7K49_003116 [Saguinus oedipus]